MPSPLLITSQDQIRGLYTLGGPTLITSPNLASVERMMRRLECTAESVGLDAVQKTHGRQSLEISDLGKNKTVVQSLSKILETALALSPDNLDHPYLNGIANWLSYYQEQAGQPLMLQSPDTMRGNKPLRHFARKINRFGNAPFAIRATSTETPYPEDRLQAVRFYKTVFQSARFFPELLMWHEIVGHVIAYSLGCPREVLEGNLFHNGPAIAMQAGALCALETYRETTNILQYRPYWGHLVFTLMASPYPFPLAGNKIAILSTMLDRGDQGILSLSGDRRTLEGGPQKILKQRLAEGSTVLKAVQDIRMVPKESEEQLHALWFYRIGGTKLEDDFMDLYRQMMGEIKKTEQALNRVDLEKSSKNEIVFQDGVSIKFDFSVTPQGFVDQFFSYLARGF